MTMEISRSRLGLPPVAPCPTIDDWRSQCLALTEPVRQDFCITRGDTGYFMLIVTEHDLQTPINISGASWDADIRLSHDDVPVAYFVVLPHPGELHIADVTLTPDQSERLDGDYVYDIQMDLNGIITTLIAGTLTVNKDVSRNP